MMIVHYQIPHHAHTLSYRSINTHIVMSSTPKSAKGGKAKTSGGKSGHSKSSKAGLTFSVGRTARLLRNGRYSRRIGAGAPVYLAAVLEYLTAELLEMSGNVAREHKKKVRPGNTFVSTFPVLCCAVSRLSSSVLPLALYSAYHSSVHHVGGAQRRRVEPTARKGDDCQRRSAPGRSVGDATQGHQSEEGR